MKATLLLCFVSLSCFSLLVGAKSTHSNHDAAKEAEANKCTCEIPVENGQKMCQQDCDCSKQDMKKCQNEKKSCDCESTEKKSEQCQCKNAQDTSKLCSHKNSTKRCNCNCNSRSKTAVSQVSNNPGILAVAPIMQQADGSQMPGLRKGKGSKKCCCCDCCHDCCCHCCEPCCCCCHDCCCHCCEPCCCCCHECCCPCCCHCCHCCPCCCHCCCKKSKNAPHVPGVINPLIAGAQAKPQHH